MPPAPPSVDTAGPPAPRRRGAHSVSSDQAGAVLQRAARLRRRGHLRGRKLVAAVPPRVGAAVPRHRGGVVGTGDLSDSEGQELVLLQLGQGPHALVSAESLLAVCCRVRGVPPRATCSAGREGGRGGSKGGRVVKRRGRDEKGGGRGHKLTAWGSENDVEKHTGSPRSCVEIKPGNRRKTSRQ